MLNAIGLVVIGAFIGWNVPQPFWAQMITEWVKRKWAEHQSKK